MFDDILAKAGKQIQTLQNDRRYSQQHRESLIMDIRKATNSEIAGRAERQLKTAQDNLGQAEEAYRAELGRWESGQDWTRQSVIDGRIATLVQHAGPEVMESVLEVAERDRDYATLAALRGRALPVMVSKAKAAGINSPEERALHGFEERVNVALDALEPADLQTARAAMHQAQQALQNTRSELSNFNWKEQQSNGSGPLDNLLDLKGGLFAGTPPARSSRKPAGVFSTA